MFRVMRISALEEYGLRCALDLARSFQSGLVSASKLAEREGISTEYASKILFLMRSSGLVRSERGNQGGFQLIDSPDRISLKRVFDAVDPKSSDKDAFCGQYSGQRDSCVHLGHCSIRPVWEDLSSHFDALLEKLTLADLLERRTLPLSLAPQLFLKSELPRHENTVV